MSNSWTVVVEEDENGDTILPFPPELIEKYGWLEGDQIEFEIEDNSIILINTSAESRKNKDDLV